MDGLISKSQRAQVLVQALPYIQKYWNRVVVIKYGGHAMESEELKRQVMEDIVLLQLVGVKVVLVHGGGPEINDLLSKLGVKSEFVNGLRVTDEETAQIVQMVLAGKVGKSLVNLIESTGGKAMGMQFMDDAIWQKLQQGIVSPEEAYMKCIEKKRFRNFLPPESARLADSGGGN